MRLFLIRHGETVDNVAGLYAGTRDSQLTNHGVEQTKRLGAYLARNNVRLSHLFASPLSRAYKTADAILQAQPNDGSPSLAAGIVKVPELIERSFGFYEGAPFSARNDGAQHDKNSSLPGFVDVESKEAMAERVDRFLDVQLLPLLDQDTESTEPVVAVVAHGMLLSSFWRRLLLRLPRKSLRIAPQIMAKRDGIVLEYIGGWSNTGYMELSFKSRNESKTIPPTHRHPSPAGSVPTTTEPTTLPTPIPPPLHAEDAEVAVAPTRHEEPEIDGKAPRLLSDWSTTVLAIDSTVHLLGLKRQRGGIGSLAHDEGQRKLESFFKKPRLT